MNWREWPKGKENAEYTDSQDKCPVCSATLRPVEIFYIAPKGYYSQELDEYYTALCLKCRTQYIRIAPLGTITISPDIETIIELTERVHNLEETLSRLIAYIRTQQQPAPTPQIPAQRQEQTQNDAEDFTRRYRHLL